MSTARLDPRCFGRSPTDRCDALPIPTRGPADDLRLFTTTFAAGFLFVSIVLA